MHFEKYKQTSVSGLLYHNERGIYTPDTANHSNENIDPSRTHLNYSLLSDPERGYTRHKKKLDEIERITKERTGRGLRKDAVTLCSWIVTAPQDLPEDKQPEFFQNTYNALCERYGEDNVISATVHNDETQPHLHFCFIPIVEDEQGNKRLCAKNLENPQSLRKIHVDLQKRLESELNCPVNILNGATAGGNKTIAQLQAETLQANNKRLEAENKALRAENEQLKKNALEYECPPKKLFESQGNYETRTQIHQQAVAVKQRESELDNEVEVRARKKAKDIAENTISDREKSLQNKVNQRDNVIEQLQRTVAEQQNELNYYRKYDPDIKKINEERKKRKLDSTVQSAQQNTYTFTNDEYFDHSR